MSVRGKGRLRGERSRKARASKPSKRRAAIEARALRMGLCFDCAAEKRGPVASLLFELHGQCRSCYRHLHRPRPDMNITDRRERLWADRKAKRA